jgi:peptidoglycan-associated lipoprotein
MLKTISKIACVLVLAAGVAGCSGVRKTTGEWGTGNWAPGSTQEFAGAVGDRVFFEVDSSELTATAVDVLNKQARWLQQNSGYRVLVEGHADERGTREYNYALGARRAKTVYDYLVSSGVTASRLRTISYGKERPVAVCNNITCWSQNRRAVTVLE